MQGRKGERKGGLVINESRVLVGEKGQIPGDELLQWGRKVVTMANFVIFIFCEKFKQF